MLIFHKAVHNRYRWQRRKAGNGRTGWTGLHLAHLPRIFTSEAGEKNPEKPRKKLTSIEILVFTHSGDLIDFHVSFIQARTNPQKAASLALEIFLALLEHLENYP